MDFRHLLIIVIVIVKLAHSFYIYLYCELIDVTGSIYPMNFMYWTSIVFLSFKLRFGPCWGFTDISQLY